MIVSYALVFLPALIQYYTENAQKIHTTVAVKSYSFSAILQYNINKPLLLRLYPWSMTMRNGCYVRILHTSAELKLMFADIIRRAVSHSIMCVGIVLNYCWS